MRVHGLILAAFAAAPAVVTAEEPAELRSTPLATAFGSAPVMWGVQLSPDGTKLSAIQMHPSGITIARVVGLEDATAAVVLAGNDDFTVTWCNWANEERLLCGLRTLVEGSNSVHFAVTRLVSTKVDGGEMKVLLENRLTDRFAQFQDRIVDWLPDDREHVLVQVPGRPGEGLGISQLNVYTGALSPAERPRPGVTRWLTDGHGTARLYQLVNQRDRRWLVRATPESPWELLHRTELTDVDESFQPIGFAESRSELLFFERHEGRMALFAYDLANDRARRLIYSHPTFDVEDVHGLGKYTRLVAAAYVDDRPHLHFFDERLKAVHDGLSVLFPGKTVAISDESWDQRYYLAFVTSATDPGSYYRFDAMTNIATRITPAYASLTDYELAPMTPVRYAADDGVEIPAYLTLPPGRSGPVPTVILPHGGPSARDYWSYDYLAQFLAANGYAVLQGNYRGSEGYGQDWLGEGGFRGWRRAVADIAAGTQYLIDEGIADPERICTVGWSYGGYAALMTAIEQPDRYRCIVSIAGVTDPNALGNAMMNFVGGRSARAFIGTDDEVRKEGSPLERAEEIRAPVLLVHGRQDANVPFRQSESLARALVRANKDVELVEYEKAEHSIVPERYRVDLLARLGAFLDEHL